MMGKRRFVQTVLVIAVVIALGTATVSAQPPKKLAVLPDAKEEIARKPMWGGPSFGKGLAWAGGTRWAPFGGSAAASPRAGWLGMRKGMRRGQGLYGVGPGRRLGRAHVGRGRGYCPMMMGRRGMGWGSRMSGRGRGLRRGRGALSGAQAMGRRRARRGGLLRKLIASGRIELDVKAMDNGAAVILRSDNEMIAKRLRKMLQRFDRVADKVQRPDKDDRPMRERRERAEKMKERRQHRHPQEKMLREKREESLERARRRQERPHERPRRKSPEARERKEK